MKTQQVTIPALQLTAAIYFAHAAPMPSDGNAALAVRCVEGSGADVAGCHSNVARDTSFFAMRRDEDAELQDDGDNKEHQDTSDVVKRAPLFDFLKKKPLTPEEQAEKDRKEAEKEAEKERKKAESKAATDSFNAFLNGPPNSAFIPTFGFGG
ncbi:hypothetical protein PspLS_09240 [Pyricularia sp. CBS 133598]|nr:hypothetical protein PspLS_09240 [Pyricularia sp. CBS 133598]